jgi:hypothetical protein
MAPDRASVGSGHSKDFTEMEDRFQKFDFAGSIRKLLLPSFSDGKSIEKKPLGLILICRQETTKPLSPRFFSSNYRLVYKASHMRYLIPSLANDHWG